MSFEAQIADEVRGLAGLGLAGLREDWQRRYGAPPLTRSIDLIARLLAWRIQSDALGGFDEPTIRLLSSTRPAPPPPVVLAPGTRLAREWRGVAMRSRSATAVFTTKARSTAACPKLPGRSPARAGTVYASSVCARRTGREAAQAKRQHPVGDAALCDLYAQVERRGTGAKLQQPPCSA